MKKHVYKLLIVTICGISLLVAGCARNITSNTYTANSIGETQFTYQGKIINVRNVTVEKGDELEQNKTGIGLGGVAGGVAGSNMGGGSGTIATTVGGAILGGVLGGFIEKGLKSQEAKEYVIRLTNKQLMTVVQGLDEIFQVGQNVMVIVSNDGRSRIVADNAGFQEIQEAMPAPRINVRKSR